MLLYAMTVKHLSFIFLAPAGRHMLFWASQSIRYWTVTANRSVVRASAGPAWQPRFRDVSVQLGTERGEACPD